MNKLALALLTIGTLSAACGGHGNGAAEGLKKLDEAATAVCAAKDLAAATKAQADYTAWATEAAKKVGDGKQAAMSEADAKAFADHSKRLADCLAKLAAAPAQPEPAKADPAKGEPAK
jgi:hypothetical protein